MSSPHWLLNSAYYAILLFATAAQAQLPAERIDVVHLGSAPLPAVREGNRLLITPLYAASLNPETKLADWVRYRVTAASCETDNVLTRNWRTVYRADALEAEDYAGSDYDRGHLIPLASVAASPAAWMANRTEVVAPMTPALNRGPWLVMENHVRDLARREGPVMVTAGTLYESELDPLPAADEPHRIPSAFWVVIQGRRTRAYIMPQTGECHLVTGAELSQRIGYVPQ